MKNEKPLKIAVLSSYTVQNIQQPLKSSLTKLSFSPQLRFGGYQQFNMELRDPHSWLTAYKPDVIVIAISTRTLFPNLQYDITADYAKTADECNELITSLLDSITNNNLPTKIILTTLETPTYSPYGIMDITMPNGVFSIIQECNNRLREYAQKHGKVVLLDAEKVYASVGKNSFTEEKMYYIGKLFLNGEAASALAEEIAVIVSAIYGMRKKCLVVDLDNTIWGGVIGEDGVQGIELGDNTVGYIYRHVQKTLLNLKRTGVLLAAVSKNNLNDVLPVFTENSNMILKQDDFIAMRINWQPKSKNIREIAEELNIGTDSMVFLDDNPAERLEVQSSLPGIAVIDFPQDIADLPKLLKQMNYFQTISLTDEDMQKHDMYVQERKRTELSQQVSTEDYLHHLGISIEVKKNDMSSLARITQLINKTNQFNLRTQRYTEEQVANMMKSGKFVVTSVKVWDKFGELGLTGVIIIEDKGQSCFIDTFLLSCRILSRGIEKQFLLETIRLIDKEKLHAEYIRTPKNELAEKFYDDLGFVIEHEAKDLKRYSVLKQALKLDDIAWITVQRG